MRTSVSFCLPWISRDGVINSEADFETSTLQRQIFTTALCPMLRLSADTKAIRLSKIMHLSSLVRVLRCALWCSIGACLVLCAADAAPTELKLGLAWPLSRSTKYAAATQTVQAVLNMINGRNDILPDVEIKLLAEDSWVVGAVYATETQGKAIAATYKLSAQGVFAVVGGDDCQLPKALSQNVLRVQKDFASETTGYGALVTTGFKIPQCVPFAGLDDLSNKKKYPYTIRMIQPNYIIGRKMMNLVAFYNWTKVAFLHSGNEYGASYVPAILDGARANNIKILLNQEYLIGAGEPRDFAQPVRNLADSGARVIVVSGKLTDGTRLYIEAAKANLTGPDYVWIIEQGVSQSMIIEQLGKNAAAVVDMSIFHVLAEEPDYEAQPFLELEDACSTAARPSVCSSETLLADCVWALAWGFDKYLTDKNISASTLVSPNYLNGSIPALDLSMFNTSKPAISGSKLNFDASGDYMYEIGKISDHRQLFPDAIWVQQYYNESNNESKGENDIKVAVIDGQMDVVATGNRAVFFGGRLDIPPDFKPSVAQNAPWNSPLSAGVAFLAVLFIVLGLVSMTLIFVYRNEAIIKKASWRSLALIASGTSIASISPLLYIGTPSKVLCILQPIVLNVGFGLTFSNLLAKTWRVHKIFANTKMMAAAVNDAKLMAFAAVIIVMELLISIVWVTYDTPAASVIYMTEVKHMLVCQSFSSSFQIAITAVSLAFNGLLLAMTTYLSYRIRTVRADYNESKWIGISVYNMVAISALFLPLIFNTPNFQQDFIGYSFILRSLSVILPVAVFQICIFGTKFAHLLRPAKSEPDMLLTVSSKRRHSLPVGEPILRTKTIACSVEKQEAKRINGVPVLQSVSGRLMALSSFFSQWKTANVIIFPGYIFLEFIGVRNAGRTKSLRTTGALVTILEDGGSSGESAGATTSFNLFTRDGALEMMLPLNVARELENSIVPPTSNVGPGTKAPATSHPRTTDQ
ncbi:periplasmic binding protein-like I [Phlyctochytrium arcticum]|nr:periplasmic binding protein-like I [Phlyctochytrium arcticum]